PSAATTEIRLSNEAVSGMSRLRNTAASSGPVPADDEEPVVDADAQADQHGEVGRGAGDGQAVAEQRDRRGTDAPGESRAGARLDRPGPARGAVPDAAQRAAPVPGRDPGNAAALAPPEGDQEVDPAPVTGTATARQRVRRADRPARQPEPDLGRRPHPGRATPPGTPDRRGHDPQDPAQPAHPAPGRPR